MKKENEVVGIKLNAEEVAELNVFCNVFYMTRLNGMHTAVNIIEEIMTALEKGATVTVELQKH